MGYKANLNFDAEQGTFTGGLQGQPQHRCCQTSTIHQEQSSSLYHWRPARKHSLFTKSRHARIHHSTFQPFFARAPRPVLTLAKAALLSLHPTLSLSLRSLLWVGGERERGVDGERERGRERERMCVRGRARMRERESRREEDISNVRVSPKAFLVHQFSACTNPPSTQRHSSSLRWAQT